MSLKSCCKRWSRRCEANGDRTVEGTSDHGGDAAGRFPARYERPRRFGRGGACCRSLLRPRFVFRAKCRDRLRCIYWDGTGMIISTKWLGERQVDLPACKRQCDLHVPRGIQSAHCRAGLYTRSAKGRKAACESRVIPLDLLEEPSRYDKFTLISATRNPAECRATEPDRSGSRCQGLRQRRPAWRCSARCVWSAISGPQYRLSSKISAPLRRRHRAGKPHLHLLRRRASSHWRDDERGARCRTSQIARQTDHFSRYACRACKNGVVQAPALARFMDGGMATTALAARIVVSKFA